MKNSYLHIVLKMATAVFAILVLFNSCESDSFNDCLSGRGSPAIERRGLYPFGNVAVYDNISLEIEQGEIFEVCIEGGKKINRMISTLIENNTLIISNESPCQLLKDPWNEVKVRLIAPDIDTLFVHNHCEINTIGLLHYSDFVVDVSACAASVNIEINSDNFQLANPNGSADIVVKGYSFNAFIFHGGHGKIDALALESKKMIVNSRSSNNTFVRGGDILLDAKIEGIGDVYYTNRPEKVITYLTNTGKLIAIN